MLHKTYSVIIPILLLLLITTLTSCVFPREKSIKKWEKEQWHIVKIDKGALPEWTIYKREIAGSKFLEYKIEGEISASPEYCLSAFKQDIYELAEGSNTQEFPVYNIVKESENSLLTYVVHREPFPLKNTEMSVRYTIEKAANEMAVVSWQEDWDDETVPASSRKLARVKSFRGSWRFSATADDNSHAINTVNFDPKKMPMWLVQPMVTKFLIRGFEKLKKDAGN